jgi:hypothetical protein
VIRSIFAVIGGYVLTGLLIFGTDQVFAFATDNFHGEATLPTYYFLISIATDTFYSIIGGWACASIARKNVMKHAQALVILGELVGIAATVYLWKTVPHYYSFALLILYPPAVLFGAKSLEWTRPIELPVKVKSSRA